MSLAVASRYANALADVVSRSQGQLPPETAWQQLRALDSLIHDSSDLRKILQSPSVSSGKKRKVVDRLAAALNIAPILRNFFAIIVRNGRSDLIPQIREAFEQALDERSGVVKVEIASAAELSDAARASLEAQLASLTGKRLRTRYSIDASLVGGLTARIGSRVYDGSVRGQLDILKRKLSARA